MEPINGRMLSVEEIKERLDKFNETVPSDWSLLEGAHPLQQVSFMYPCYIKPFSEEMITKSLAQIEQAKKESKSDDPIIRSLAKIKLNSNY